MKTIEKFSECDDKLLDPRTLTYRLKRPIRKKINRLFESLEESRDLEVVSKKKEKKRSDRKDDKKDNSNNDNDEVDEIEKLKSRQRFDDMSKLKELLDSEEESSKDHRLSYDDVSKIHQLLQRLDESYDLFFWQFLDECRAFVENERQNKELEQRLKILQMDSGLKSYREMTRGVNVSKPSADNGSMLSGIGSEFRSLKPTLIALVNSLLVIVGTFVFVYKAVEYSLTSPDIVLQVFTALIASIIVAIAEIYFLVKVI